MHSFPGDLTQAKESMAIFSLILASVCDYVAWSWFELYNLCGTLALWLSWSRRTWHACYRSRQRVRCSDIVGQPVVVSAASSYPLGVVPGFSECSKCLLWKFLFVVEKCCSLDWSCWLELENTCLQPVWILPLSPSENVLGRDINVGITDVIPPHFNTFLTFVSKLTKFKTCRVVPKFCDVSLVHQKNFSASDTHVTLLVVTSIYKDCIWAKS